MSEENPSEKDQESPVTLAETLARYEISLPAKKIRLLEEYARALWDWNTRLNLTRHTDWEKFVTRDLVDSLRLAAHLQQGERLLDVGTGGGVPGVPLAILRPDLDVELCDSTGKKTAALGAILDAVDLKNTLWHAKAEELLAVRKYHTLVIRAVSKMDKILTMFAPCWQSFDRILLIKGPSWAEERGVARHLGLLNNIALRKIDDYQNPGAEHESVILQLCHKNRLGVMKQRAEDLAAGVPIARLNEELGVDNRSDQKTAPGTKSAPGAKKSERKKPFDSARGKTFSDKKTGKGWVHPETPFHQSKNAAQSRSGSKPSGRPSGKSTLRTNGKRRPPSES